MRSLISKLLSSLSSNLNIMRTQMAVQVRRRNMLSRHRNWHGQCLMSWQYRVHKGITFPYSYFTIVVPLARGLRLVKLYNRKQSNGFSESIPWNEICLNGIKSRPQNILGDVKSQIMELLFEQRTVNEWDARWPSRLDSKWVKQTLEKAFQGSTTR